MSYLFSTLLMGSPVRMRKLYTFLFSESYVASVYRIQSFLIQAPWGQGLP